MPTWFPRLAAALLLALMTTHGLAPPAAASEPSVDIAKGRYLVEVAGCTDCHTANYAAREGKVPEQALLTGSNLGHRGPWGTTYATNLRLRMQELTEAQWMDYSATLRTRPIMPDFRLRSMPADERRAIYRYIRSLGPSGVPAPQGLPPGAVPPPPYTDLILGPAPARSSAAAASR